MAISDALWLTSTYFFLFVVKLKKVVGFEPGDILSGLVIHTENLSFFRLPIHAGWCVGGSSFCRPRAAVAGNSYQENHREQ